MLTLSCAAAAEEAVRRVEVDAGVHVPVLTKAPELLEFVKAVHPPEALAKGLTADVTLSVTIGADGAVTEARVTTPAGEGFDEAAIAAVRAFRFSPAEVDGAPAPVTIEYTYHFTQEAPVPPPDEPPPPLEQATLKGELIARGSRTRVPSATVRCGEAADAAEATSDEEGRFELKVPPGECLVKVVASDFQLFETSELLAAGESTEVVYHLLPKAIGYETVVRGKREKKEVVRRTLERRELQRVPGSFGDPVRVLQNFPGVARAPFVLGTLIVRGASPAQTLTFLDGVKVPILYHFGGGPSVVNSEFLDRIDFFPGGFGAHYGRAVGGIVDVGTRRGASDTYHGSVKVDLQDTSVFFEAPLAPGVSIAGAARRSYIDGLLPLVMPKSPDGGSLLVVPVYWDYQVRLDLGGRRGEVARDGNSTYSVMAFGSDDVMKVVASGVGTSVDVSVDLHTVFHRVVGSWNYRKGNVTFQFTPYVGYDLASISLGEISARLNEWEVGLREDLQVEVNPHVTVRAGVDLLFDHLDGAAEIPMLGGTQYVAFPGSDPQTESQKIEQLIDAFDGAAFVEADLKAGPLTLTPGFRASHAFLIGETRYSLEPRLWVRYALREGTMLKGSAGLYQQAPNVVYLEPSPFGNPGLGHEKAFQASVGFEQKLTDSINVDITGYYNRRYENVVSTNKVVVNDDGSRTALNYVNEGLGRAFGLEVMLRHEVTRDFFGWISYTLNRAESSRVGQSSYYLNQYDQTHILTLVGSYRLPLGFEVGARFRYVSGNPSTPLEHRYDLYNADTDSFGTSRGPYFSSRLQPFQQLDLRVDRTWLFNSWTLGAYVDVQNVYNAQNVEATFTDYRRRQEFTVPGIPILPIVGVKGSF
ncbi:MAG: TonB family protein [Myxococcaceae bacterium]